MAERLKISGLNTLENGRFVLSARTTHLISDATPARGGAGEAFVAQELYLAALSTCALAVIEEEARRAGLHPRIAIAAEVEIDAAIGPGYRSCTLDIRFEGAGQEEAEDFVAAFTAVCPIYYTLAQTTPVTIRVAAAGRSDA